MPTRMKLKMNRAFEERWRVARIGERINTIALEDGVLDWIESRIVEVGDALVFERSVSSSTSREAFVDATDYEAFINKLHVEDVVQPGRPFKELLDQGVGAAIRLARRLERLGSCQVVLSVSEPDMCCVLRFFRLRDGVEQLADDLDSYEEEGILVIEP